MTKRIIDEDEKGQTDLGSKSLAPNSLPDDDEIDAFDDALNGRVTIIDDDHPRAAHLRAGADDDDPDDQKRELESLRTERAAAHARAEAAEGREYDNTIEAIRVAAGERIERYDAQRLAVKSSMAQLDADIRALNEAKVAAIDTGNTAMQLRIDEQLGDARDKKARLRDAGDRIPTRDDVIAEARQFVSRLNSGRQKAPSSVKVADRVVAHNARAQEWAKANAWMGDKRYSPQQSYLIGLGDQLANEGLDPDSDHYFRELTARMREAFPNLDVRGLRGEAPRSRVAGSGGTPVAGARSSSASRVEHNGTRQRLTTDEKAMIRQLKLDVSDPAVVSRFLLERSGRERSEASRSRS